MKTLLAGNASVINYLQKTWMKKELNIEPICVVFYTLLYYMFINHPDRTIYFCVVNGCSIRVNSSLLPTAEKEQLIHSSFPTLDIPLLYPDFFPFNFLSSTWKFEKILSWHNCGNLQRVYLSKNSFVSFPVILSALLIEFNFTAGTRQQFADYNNYFLLLLFTCLIYLHLIMHYTSISDLTFSM